MTCETSWEIASSMPRYHRAILRMLHKRCEKLGLTPEQAYCCMQRHSHIGGQGSCPSVRLFFCRVSGKTKEHKPKLSSPDMFRWGRGLPREGVGAKKFGMSLETREIKLFWRDIPGFCWDIPAVSEKFEKRKFVFNFWPHTVLKSRPPSTEPKIPKPRKVSRSSPKKSLGPPSPTRDSLIGCF